MAEKKYPDIYGSESEDEFLRLARKRFADGMEKDSENREAAEEDLQFKAGEQWSDADKADRSDEGRPIITINRMPQFIRQVTGDIRINRPSVKVLPVDDNADPGIAEVFTGLIRNIEQQSKARIAYNTAADAAATGGLGHFRIVTDYVSDDVFDQDILIKRMTNPFSVVWDPYSMELTREDARYCFVHDMVPAESFEQQWPDANVSAFDAMENVENVSDWYEDGAVRVCEYWVKVPEKRTICQLEDGSVIVKEETDGYAALPIVKERVVEVPRVKQYIISGAEVLEGPNEWPGRHIPIVPVVGEEIFIGDRCVRHGVIRFAKDPQRLYNYMRTATVEATALAPKSPYIGTVKMFQANESAWREANRANTPYLPYTPDDKAPGMRPERQMPPQLSTALANETAVAADDMKAVTGIYDAGLGNRSNETSGIAIRARQQEGDVGSYVYMDNLSIAIGYCGEMLVDLIPKIYDTERVVRLLNEDESEGWAHINVQNPDGTIANDISIGRYDVVVQTGPSYSTKRIEASDSMMQFVQAVPQAGGIIADLIAKNQDWPGADAIAERLKKILPPGIDEDAPAPQPPPPDPKMVAEVAKAEAEVEKAGVEIEGKKLDNAQKELELAQMMGAIPQMVQQAVRQTLLEISGGGMPRQPGSPGFFDGEIR